MKILVLVVAAALTGGGPDIPQQHPIDAAGELDHDSHWSWHHTRVWTLAGTVVLAGSGIAVVILKRRSKNV